MINFAATQRTYLTGEPAEMCKLEGNPIGGREAIDANQARMHQGGQRYHVGPVRDQPARQSYAQLRHGRPRRAVRSDTHLGKPGCSTTLLQSARRAKAICNMSQRSYSASNSSLRCFGQLIRPLWSRFSQSSTISAVFLPSTLSLAGGSDHDVAGKDS